MRREEKVRKNRGSEVVSKGVLVLILLMLAVQFIYFIVYVIRDARQRNDAHEPERIDTVYIVRTDTVYLRIPKKGTQTLKNYAEDSQADLRKAVRGDNYQYDGWKWDRVELNTADSATLDDLPGIGPYYAKQILRYRQKLWGSFHDVHQLMEIRGIDADVFAKLEQRVYIDTARIRYYDLYTIGMDSLAKHPYIGSYMAADIERFRSMLPCAEFSLDTLVGSKVITQAQAQRISICFR